MLYSHGQMDRRQSSPTHWICVGKSPRLGYIRRPGSPSRDGREPGGIERQIERRARSRNLCHLRVYCSHCIPPGISYLQGPRYSCFPPSLSGLHRSPAKRQNSNINHGSDSDDVQSIIQSAKHVMPWTSKSSRIPQPFSIHVFT